MGILYNSYGKDLEPLYYTELSQQRGHSWALTALKGTACIGQLGLGGLHLDLSLTHRYIQQKTLG